MGPEDAFDLDFEFLMNPPIVWEATGDTFHLREGFVSWGWHWVKANRSWQLQGSDEDCPCLKWAQRQPGVTVKKLQVEKLPKEE